MTIKHITVFTHFPSALLGICYKLGALRSVIIEAQNFHYCPQLFKHACEGLLLVVPNGIQHHFNGFQWAPMGGNGEKIIDAMFGYLLGYLYGKYF